MRRWIVMGPLVLAGCGGASSSPDGTAEAARLDDLASRYWDFHLRSSPLTATFLGERRYDHLLDDITPEGRAESRNRVSAFLDELSTIDSTLLSGQPRLTRLALREALENEQLRDVCALPDWSVDHRNGPHVTFLNVAGVQSARTPAEATAVLERWNAMAAYLDEHIANLRRGRETGQVPARAGVELVIAQLEGLLGQPSDQWAFLQPGMDLRAWAPDQRRAFRAALRTVVINELRPAFVRLRDALRDEVLPSARPGNRVGLTYLPGGDTCYRGLIRVFTSLDLGPDEVHRIGVEELARIREEMRELGGQVLGTSDLEAIQRRLRQDPEMHFDSEQEILWTAEEAAERARSVIDGWFGRRPASAFVVRPIPDYEAPYTQVAYYRAPAADGSRPGTYFVNTYRPETRPRYQAEVLAFHEGIPGHHFQLSLAQELTELPAFRRHTGATAFLEGWALYSERLADEMGLYSSDLDRLGALSYDAWRASRLIVDTGIHAYGWSRDRAITFLEANTLLSHDNVENEVDRYITWPAQALSYKLGQLEILKLRAETRVAFADAFDIRAFHDRVLQNGAVSLSILREVMTAWSETQDAAGP